MARLPSLNVLNKLVFHVTVKLFATLSYHSMFFRKPWTPASASYRQKKYDNVPLKIEDYEPGLSSLALNEPPFVRIQFVFTFTPGILKSQLVSCALTRQKRMNTNSQIINIGLNVHRKLVDTEIYISHSGKVKYIDEFQ